jgi:hypothetical protein
LLHVYKSLTVWIRTPPKIIAGKLIAIAKAISDLIHSGTIQNCARASKQPTLGVEFLGCLKTGAGTAAGAGTQQVQFANITVNSTGAGGHRSILLIFQKKEIRRQMTEIRKGVSSSSFCHLSSDL